MALTQSRIHEKDGFVNDGTYSLDDVKIAVDHPDFTDTQNFPLSSVGLSSGGTHIERGRLTELSSRSVSVTFDTAFSNAPIGKVWVYRMAEMPDGNYREQDVLWGFTSSTKVSTTGFSIAIDSSESLTNVVVEYYFL